jgi:hypothetical protein
MQYLRVVPRSLLTNAMTRLQELNISDGLVSDGDGSLEAALVSVGPSLRTLCILRSRELHGFVPHEAEHYLVPFPNTALPFLTALTKLQLAGSVRSAEQLSDLLRELSIQSDGGINIQQADLPASGKLTSLSFHNVLDYPDPPTVAVAALSRVPQLQSLVLKSFVAPDEGGTAALLQELAQLTQLTLLALHDGPLDLPLTAAVALAAYSSLTASSNLQTLTIEGANMPDGVWQHVFGAARQLSQLKSLVLLQKRWTS